VATGGKNAMGRSEWVESGEDIRDSSNGEASGERDADGVEE